MNTCTVIFTEKEFLKSCSNRTSRSRFQMNAIFENNELSRPLNELFLVVVVTLVLLLELVVEAESG